MEKIPIFRRLKKHTNSFILMKKLYISILLILLTVGLKAQNWAALTLGDANSEVYAVAVDPNGTVYAGGSFPGYFKKWNGSTWVSPISGQDPNGAVYSIAVKTASSIYIGGAFTMIGTTSFRYIAQLGSTAWYRLGSGFNNPVKVVYSNPNGNSGSVTR